MTDQISGQVIGPDGTPVQGAVVQIVQQDPPPAETMVARQTTNSNGEYFFDETVVRGKGPWHVTVRYEENGQLFNDFSKPYVDADLLEETAEAFSADLALEPTVVDRGAASIGINQSQVNLSPDISESASAGPDIPDSAIAQYDAQALSGNDGDGLSTWPDEIGNNDITGGNPIIRDAGINGNRSLEFDGVNDSLDISFSTISQPNTIISVVEFGKSDTTEDSFIIDSESNSDHAVSQGRYEKQSIEAGSLLRGAAVTQDPILITGIFDGSNSVIKENGSQQNTGDAGNNGLTGISVGINQSGNTDDMYQGYIGEIMVYESRLSSSEIDSEEQRLADKWGITL